MTQQAAHAVLHDVLALTSFAQQRRGVSDCARQSERNPVVQFVDPAQRPQGGRSLKCSAALQATSRLNHYNTDEARMFQRLPHEFWSADFLPRNRQFLLYGNGPRRGARNAPSRGAGPVGLDRTGRIGRAGQIEAEFTLGIAAAECLREAGSARGEGREPHRGLRQHLVRRMIDQFDAVRVTSAVEGSRQPGIDDRA